MVAVDHDEREMPFELGERSADGLDEIALVVVLDEMRHGLGVGFRREPVPVGRQALDQLPVVLDDPVQHDRDPARLAAGQRVRVLLGDPAVRRPARVPEPGRGRRAARPRALDQVSERPDGAYVLEAVLLEERDARGVVAAVLEALEPLQEQRLALTRSDVPDDPAHWLPPGVSAPKNA